PAVQNARLRHFDRPDTRDQRARRMMAVLDHELSAALVPHVAVPRDPVLHFGVDRLDEYPLGPVPQNRGQHVATGHWNRRPRVATLTHRRTPLPIVGGSEPRTSPESTPPFFQPAINEIRS